MNAPAALLYRAEAAWQSPRVAQRKAAPARDVDGDNDEVVTRTIKRHWGPIVTILGVVVPVLLAYGDIKKDLAVLSTEVANLKSAKSGAAGLAVSASASTRTPLSPSAVPVPSGSTSAPVPSALLSAAGPGRLPPMSKAKPPPVCVNAAPVGRFSCDQTAVCRDVSEFKATFVADVRTKLKLDDSREILFCEPAKP